MLRRPQRPSGGLAPLYPFPSHREYYRRCADLRGARPGATRPSVRGLPMPALVFHLSRAAISAAAVLLGLAIIEIGCAPADLQFLAPSVTGRAPPSFAPVVQGVMPTVVNVSAIQRASKTAADQTELRPGHAKNQSALGGLPPSALDE